MPRGDIISDNHGDLKALSHLTGLINEHHRTTHPVMFVNVGFGILLLLSKYASCSVKFVTSVIDSFCLVYVLNGFVSPPH